MTKLVETEIKLFVPDTAPVVERLAQAGATLKAARVYEHNVRYENADETFTAQGIVLRMRQDTRARLTFKAPPDQRAASTNVITRFEAEVTVDSFDAMDIILQRLGFHPHVVYEKYRTTYQLGEAEIVLDEMPYGTFLEVEGSAPAIDATLAALGLAGAPRILASYMALFEQVKAALDLDVHDLTFANFEGIDVPPDVFYSLDSHDA